MQWRYMEWKCSSTILDLSIKWRWVVSFMLWLLYPWEEPKSQSGLTSIEKNLLPMLGIEPWLSKPILYWVIPITLFFRQNWSPSYHTCFKAMWNGVPKANQYLENSSSTNHALGMRSGMVNRQQTVVHPYKH
jgi:hypothetical protein